MTTPLHPGDPPSFAEDWPRTVAEAVDRLALSLTQAEKEEIAGMAESDLITLHFGLGILIRNEFGLWRDNRALLLDCQRLKFKDMANVPDGPLAIHPDDAAMLIIRALWARLRH